jgi:putative hemolysin
MGIDPNAEDEELTEEEIRMMVDAGSEKGKIHPEEKDMIQNVFEFDDKTAEEVMTHRTEVSLLWMDEDDISWEDTIIGDRHSVYPVCGESADNIVGVLYAKDYFRMRDRTRERVMESAVRPAYFVPETVRTDVLFRNMKNSRTHFAIVLDDHGGMSGIITMNDLLEQLVGELEDDASAPEQIPEIERVDSSTWLVRGTASVEEVSKKLGVELQRSMTVSEVLFSDCSAAYRRTGQIRSLRNSEC